MSYNGQLARSRSAKQIHHRLPNHQRDPRLFDPLRAICANDCGVDYALFDPKAKTYDYDVEVQTLRDAVFDDGTPGGRTRFSENLVKDSVEYVRDRATKPLPDIDTESASHEEISQFVDRLMTMVVLAVCDGVKS